MVANPFGNQTGAPVEDIERKVDIWSNQAAGNHSNSKLKDMNIDYEKTSVLFATRLCPSLPV
ncbi:hypothetical protein MH215_17470 [Paenibacillus sp. ACRSA]|nr:hypothetical protein [Paenibacillus sp. ACRSA]